MRAQDWPSLLGRCRGKEQASRKVHMHHTNSLLLSRVLMSIHRNRQMRCIYCLFLIGQISVRAGRTASRSPEKSTAPTARRRNKEIPLAGFFSSAFPSSLFPPVLGLAVRGSWAGRAIRRWRPTRTRQRTARVGAQEKCVNCMSAR